MQDVMIFGDGHKGSLREIEEGKDFILVTSKPVLSDKGPPDMLNWEARGGLRFDVITIEQGGQSYLIGVRNDPPTIKEIDEAIRRYRPNPIS